MIYNKTNTEFTEWFCYFKMINVEADKLLPIEARNLDKMEFMNYYNEGMDIEEAGLEHFANTIYNIQ